VSQICSDAGSVHDIVEIELVNERGNFAEERERLGEKRQASGMRSNSIREPNLANATRGSKDD
jgi:hypothetical protein